MKPAHGVTELEKTGKVLLGSPSGVLGVLGVIGTMAIGVEDYRNGNSGRRR